MQFEQFEANAEQSTGNTAGSLGIEFEDFSSGANNAAQVELPGLELFNGGELTLASGEPQPLDGLPPLRPNDRWTDPGKDS